MAKVENPRTYPYRKLYGFTYRPQNLMKLFLYETRYLELSNHINYKPIGFEMKELWIFEVNPRILFTIPTSMGC